MNFLVIENETEEEFEKIARILFDEYAIQTYNALYRLAEIEFYWYSESHKDNSTYKRIHVDPNAGEWFFHYSGVDIALKNPNSGGYGGILIRSIYDVRDPKKLIKGPMVCAMKLFSGTNAFTSQIKTQIVPHEFEKSEIKKGPRIGLTPKENGADKLNYSFIINPTK